MTRSLHFPLTRLGVAIGSASVLLATTSAQHLIVGGPDTVIRRAVPVSSEFDVVGACGGIVESMVAHGDVTYIGDRSGLLYRYDPSVGVSYAFNVSNDAAALATDGHRLFVGGSDGSIESYDLATESLLETWRGPAGLRALVVAGTNLYAAGDSGLVSKTGLFGSGDFSTFFDAATPVTALVADQAVLVVGSGTGLVQSVVLGTGAVSSTFQVQTDVTAMGINLGNLLVGSADGTIRRVDLVDGTAFDATLVGSSISAIALTAGEPPVWSYCYGIQCPCGNDDPLAGCVNSTGRGARLTAAGTASASTDDFVLYMTGAPAHATTVFFMGSRGTVAPLSAGVLCIDPAFGIQRFGALQTNQFGALSLGGIGAQARDSFSAAFQITAGSDWHFQAWFRDSSGPCGASSNTTNTAQLQFSM